MTGAAASVATSCASAGSAASNEAVESISFFISRPPLKRVVVDVAGAHPLYGLLAVLGFAGDDKVAAEYEQKALKEAPDSTSKQQAKQQEMAAANPVPATPVVPASAAPKARTEISEISRLSICVFTRLNKNRTVG